MTPIFWTLAIAGAYFVGAIPFGFLIGRSKGIDIRAHGSGNIGATNVRRVLGRGPGNLCFILDVLKGAMPTLVVGLLTDALGNAAITPAQAWLWLGVAAATILGHIFPIYLKLNGGKGVATAFGALLAIYPIVTPAAAIALLVWIATLKLSRYVSVSSCVAAVALPASIALLRLLGWPAHRMGDLAFVGAAWPFLVLTTLLALLVIYRHRGNLKRVIAGTEPRVGASREDRAVVEASEKASPAP